VSDPDDTDADLLTQTITFKVQNASFG